MNIWHILLNGFPKQREHIKAHKIGEDERGDIIVASNYYEATNYRNAPSFTGGKFQPVEKMNEPNKWRVVREDFRNEVEDENV
jgi:hypothetical protein